MTHEQQKNIFDQWIADHSRLLFKIVRAYAFNVMDRDDLFQEISIQVWRSIPAFRSESAVTTWLYRVSLNTALKWSRKERRVDREPLDARQCLLEDDPSPLDERLVWLYGEISRLDEIDRSITLLMLDGFSYKEMSGILGITESNVGVKINRIKKQLTIKSKKYDYGV